LRLEILEDRTVPSIAMRTPLPLAHVVSTSASGPAPNTLTSIRVTFDQGLSPATFTSADLGLLGPGKTRITFTSVTVVAGTADRVFDLAFREQSRVGTYTLYIGQEARDLIGRKITPYHTQFLITGPTTPAGEARAHVVSATSSGPDAHTLSRIRLTFDRGISVTSLTPGDLNLLGPGKNRIAISSVTVVPGTDDRVFDVAFARQSTAGTYMLYVGQEARDLSGNRIAPYHTQFKLAGTSKSTSDPAPRYTPKLTTTSFTSTTPVTIPPHGRGVSMLKVAANVTIVHISVRLNVLYPQVGDLTIHLQAPDGTDIVLADRMGGTTPNLPNTTFDDNSSLSMAFVAGPYTGSYQPQTPLSYLNGEKTAGTWRLWVENHGAGKGTLTGWSLTVKPR
jgi:subtilisin-like proprotein convertase family protein